MELLLTISFALWMGFSIESTVELVGWRGECNKSKSSNQSEEINQESQKSILLVSF